MTSTPGGGDAQTPYRRKLIEVDLPLAAINREAAREKSLRHGHPSTLHLWWARRPLAACRAVVFASMVDDPSSLPAEFPTAEAQHEERKRLHDIIEKLVVWEHSNDETLLAQARWEIARSVARSRGEQPPPREDAPAVLGWLAARAPAVYDPFCGGGSIPLEAQRLGLRAVGTDLNPVAVLITKALIELPPKFRDRPPANPDADRMGMTAGKGRNARRLAWRGAAGLADDIRWYGRWMRERAWERIGHLYPPARLADGGEATVIAWLWARTVPCPNPACGVAMPLMKTFQLSTKPRNQHWTRPVPGDDGVAFEVQNHAEGVPDGGTVDRNGATCVVCGTGAPLAYVREQARAGHMGERMTAVVAEGDRKRLFVSPTPEHEEAASTAKPDWCPSGTLPERALGFRVQRYGFREWSQLFTERQLTAITTFSDLVSDVRTLLGEHGMGDEYADTVVTYLALAVGKSVDSSCKFSKWRNAVGFADGVFSRQALPMLWDFTEVNLFSTSTQNWLAQVEWVARVVERLPAVSGGEARQANAATTIHTNEGPVIVTDPPYYDNVGYADLSDFFYVWLRSALRDVHPELFVGIATPKDDEMTASPRFETPRQHFEETMAGALDTIRERCTPDFPSSIFYAYKQQEEEREGVVSTGWDTMLTALVRARFQIVATWPMHTEMANRPRGLGSNSLATSVVLVCRPRAEDAAYATRREFLDALDAELPAALDHLTREGHIAPVDLAQAAIGPGMEVYSRYAGVETIAGEPVTVREALGAINRAVAAYHRGEQGALDAPSRFCVDWLRQHGMGEGPYGDAETLARTHDIVVESLAPRLLTSEGGVVQLQPLEGEAYAEDPRQLRLGGIAAWEGAFRMAHALDGSLGDTGVAGAAAVMRAMGSGAGAVERLARILYAHFDARGDSRNAVRWNGLAASWRDIEEEASRAGRQGEMGLGG